jgi:hypothetical protein
MIIIRGGGGTPYIKVYGKARPERVYFSVRAGPGKGSISLYSGKGYVFREDGLGKGVFFVKVVWERVFFVKVVWKRVCFSPLWSGKGYHFWSG